MRDELPEDAKTVWQDQPAEPAGVTLESLRRKARELRMKTRRELLGNSALALITIGTSVHGFIHTHQRGWHMVQVLFSAWALLGWYIAYRRLWPERFPVTMTPSDGLRFYRRELQRRNDVFRRFLPWSFAPAILAMVSWLLVLRGLAARVQISVNFFPVCTLLVLWTIGIFVLRVRTRSELKQELDELAAIERENNGSA